MAGHRAGDKVVAVLLAGGSGSRFGAGVSKVYVDLGGRAILAHSLQLLHDHDQIDEVVVVIRDGDQDAYAAVTAPRHKIRAVVVGGATRQRSEWAGIQAAAALGDRDADPAGAARRIVLLHDAARPLTAPELVSRLITSVRTRGGGAIPALPVADDLVDTDGRPVATDDLVAVQTPQAFGLAALVSAYPAAIRAGFDGVDTAQTVQAHADVEIRWLPGDPRNLKITHPPDLDRAQALLASMGRPLDDVTR